VKRRARRLRKKKIEDLAWERRQAEAMIRDLLSSSSEEEDEEEGMVKWNKDITADDLLDGSYDNEDTNMQR
jgi:hypothetical protein